MRNLVRESITYTVDDCAQCINTIDMVEVNEQEGFCTCLAESILSAVRRTINIGKITPLRIPMNCNHLVDVSLRSIVFCFVVRSDRERHIVLSCDASTGQKIWVEGCLIATCNASKPVEFAVHAGENIIILTGGNGKLPGLRINDLGREKHAPASVVFGTYHKHGRHIFIHENRYSPDQRYLYEFYITPGIKDILDITLPVRVEVRLRDTKESIKTFEVPFYQKAQLDLTKLDYDATQFNWITVSFLYMRKDGYDWMETRAFYFYSMRHYFEQQQQRLYSLCSCSASLTENAYFACQAFLEESSSIDPDSLSAILWTNKVNKSLLRLLSESEQSYFSKPGVNYLYFRSRLDGRIICTPFRVPNEYKVSKALPLFVIYSLVDYAELCRGVGIPSAVVLDLTCRGMTLGSYVGEACVQEIMERILSVLNIDQSRIYAIGYCGAGTAALLHQQLSPGFYAGIIVAASTINTDLICNLVNTPIWAIEPSDDSHEKWRTETYALMKSKLPLFHEVQIEACTHNMLNHAYLQKAVIMEMLKYHSAHAPENYSFCSFISRHLRAYSICIDGIDPKANCTEISLQQKERYITITVKDATGFVYQIPQEMMQKDISISVNGRTYKLPKCTQASIHFVQKEHGEYSPASPSDAIVAPRKYKGTGLLDVYLDPLRIWLVPEFTEENTQIAARFVFPKTNAVDPNIAVRYPIGIPESIEDLSTSSWVIIDDCSVDCNPLLDTIRESLIVQNDSDGFFLGDKHYYGAYSMLQIVENPYNSAYSILYIGCSSLNMLNENVFTRRWTLPSYVFGIHPYLNHEVLLHRNQKYYSISEDHTTFHEIMIT